MLALSTGKNVNMLRRIICTQAGGKQNTCKKMSDCFKFIAMLRWVQLYDEQDQTRILSAKFKPIIANNFLRWILCISRWKAPKIRSKKKFYQT